MSANPNLLDLPHGYTLGRLRHSDLDNLFLRADGATLAAVLAAEPDLVPRMRRDVAAVLRSFSDDFSPRPLLERLTPIPASQRDELLAQYFSVFDPEARAEEVRVAASRFFEALESWLVRREADTTAEFDEMRARARALREVLGALPRSRWMP